MVTAEPLGLDDGKPAATAERIRGSLRIVEGRSSSQRVQLFSRLGAGADLLIVGTILALWSLPLTTSAALATATVVAVLAGRSASPRVCTTSAGLAGGAAGRVGLVLLAALPVALVDGALPAALTAGATTVITILGVRYLLAMTVCGRSVAGGRIAIVGTGPLALEIAEYFIERQGAGCRPVGFIDRQVRGEVVLPVLGSPEDLESIVVDEQIDTLIVAFGGFSESELVPALRRCEELPIEVVVLPRFFELSLGNTGAELWGYPVSRLQETADARSSWRLKRLLDVVGASLLVVVAAPLMLAVAVAVRGTSSGPIFFKQERVGHRGRVFQMYKFRSMLENDDSDTTWSVEFDDRVTPVGRFIRLTHLDELPQLFNVLRGDMSLVGPRPERPYFAQMFANKFESYDDRHRVPVGITGWSQVNGLWGDTSLEARSRLDNRYIESWSIGRDLKILLKTIPTIFRGRS